MSRGIGTGVGKFRDGQLKLSRLDIESIVGPSQGTERARKGAA